MVPDVAIPTYDQAYGGLSSVFDPQVSQVNTEIAGLQPQQDAQQSALDQAKVNAFRDITNSANAKGMLFSGFSPDQQAQYVGTKYLPAVANLKTSFANQKNTLLDKINQINAQRSQQAQGIVSSAQSAANTAAYNNARLQISASKASGGSGGSSAANKAPTAAQIRTAIQGGLQSVVGKDGYVSPQDYAAGLKDWLQAGLPRAQYNQQYKNYRNPGNPYYDYAVKQAGL